MKVKQIELKRMSIECEHCGVITKYGDTSFHSWAIKGWAKAFATYIVCAECHMKMNDLVISQQPTAAFAEHHLKKIEKQKRCLQEREKRIRKLKTIKSPPLADLQKTWEQKENAQKLVLIDSIAKRLEEKRLEEKRLEEQLKDEVENREHASILVWRHDLKPEEWNWLKKDRFIKKCLNGFGICCTEQYDTLEFKQTA